MEAIAKVIEGWRRQRIGLLEPYKEAVIVSVLAQLNRKVSLDVIEMYRMTGGMEDRESDEHLFSLWSLDRVKTDHARYPCRGIVFADFLIDSHFYFFQFEDEHRSSVYVDFGSEMSSQLIAESVNEFFELYLVSPARLELFD
jgi:hypothetical protein